MTGEPEEGTTKEPGAEPWAAGPVKGAIKGTSRLTDSQRHS